MDEAINLMGHGIAAPNHAASTIPNLIYQEYPPMMLGLSNRFLKHPINCKTG